MPSRDIESFMLKKNPEGAPYWTSIEGSFDCQECHEKVNTAVYQERTGEIRWQCSQKHESRATM
jgi:hypothetical protein